MSPTPNKGLWGSPTPQPVEVAPPQPGKSTAVRGSERVKNEASGKVKGDTQPVAVAPMQVFFAYNYDDIETQCRNAGVPPHAIHFSKDTHITRQGVSFHVAVVFTNTRTRPMNQTHAQMKAFPGNRKFQFLGQREGLQTYEKEAFILELMRNWMPTNLALSVQERATNAEVGQKVTVQVPQRYRLGFDSAGLSAPVQGRGMNGIVSHEVHPRTSAFGLAMGQNIDANQTAISAEDVNQQTTVALGQGADDPQNQRAERNKGNAGNG